MDGHLVISTPKPSDLLFLISQYFQTLSGFEQSAHALQGDLARSGLMGTTIGWNGVPRVCDVGDLQRNYPNIAPDHLNHLLQTALAHLAKSSNASPSLLHQIRGVFNALVPAQCKRYMELSSKYAEIASRFRASILTEKKNTHRISFLERALEDCANCADSDNESERLIPDMGQDEDVIPVLQEVGRTKELAHLKAQGESLKSTQSLLQMEVKTLTQELAQLGCLSSGIHRGHLEGGLSWLQAREMGIASMGSGSSVALGRALVPSASTVQSKLATNYRLLWTVNGHMMNPAYCCVFDQTGRFILSGADDYLVKIWDVATGQLIRTCKGHMGYISLIAVSPDNSLFASACTMGTIRIWRLSDGLCLQVLKHKASVNWIKFDRTSCALASASDDGHCIVWDLSKLLPEDAAEVPILDVIIEDRAAALKAAGAASGGGSGSASKKREVEQLQDNYYEQGGSAGPAGEHMEVTEAASTHSGSSSSGAVQNVYSAAHVGEARLVSAVSSSAAAVMAGTNSMVGQAGAWAGDAGAAAAAGGPMHAPIRLFNSRGGLFRWSGGIGGQNQEENEAMLILNHVEDMFQINRAGDPLKVQCLDISPMGNILVTGCEDGVGRVWRIGDPEQVVGYSTRQVRMPIEDTLMKLKVLCSPNEYARLKRVASHLLLRLEGHVSPITDIHLNHLGDRVLTGSAQDCSVRIWSLSRDHTKSVQVVLDLMQEEEEDEVGDASVPSRVRGGRNARTRAKSQLYNACWTSDSARVVTIQSVLLPGSGGSSDALPTRLKVWDAMTGDLLRVIWKISDTSCRSLCTHPLNPAVVATCGEDGFVNVWDVDQEERLSSTRIFNDDKTTPSNIIDASFSEDGTRIAVTDFLGRLTVLGLEDPDRYRHVPTEQYFSTDYLDIMLDNVGFAIDVGTQLPVHEAPIGPLIRMDGTPYDNQPPVRPGPPPMPKEDVRAMMAEIAQDRKKSLKEMDRVFNIFTRNQHRGRVPRKYRGSKPKSLRRAEEAARSQAGSASGSAPRESRVQYIEFDVNTYNPSTDESDDSDYHRERSPDITRSHRFRGESSGRSARQAREPRETRSRVATLQSSQRRSQRSRTHVESYDDAIGDNEYTVSDTVATRASRAQLRDMRRRQQRRAEDDYSGSSETETEESGSEDLVFSSDEPDEDGGTRRSARARATRGRSGRARNPISDEDEDTPEAAPRPKKPKPAVFYQAKHGTVLSEGVEVGRKWLQSEALTPQYCPQLGDKVMYFPQGHIQWLQAFQESSSPPWMSFPQKWPIVECEVRDVQYVFPDTAQEYKMCCSVKAKVQLAVVRVPLRHAINAQGQYVLEMVAPRATRHSTGKEITFGVTLRDWDMPDFLIPSDIFMRSIRLAWHRGVCVHVQFKDYSTEEKCYVFKTYYGQVEGINNASAEWPHSPWDCIQVNWDDAEENSADAATRVGPWEAIPQFDASSDYAQILARFPLTKLPESEAQRILAGIDALMADPKYKDLFSPFAYEVDSQAFPIYYQSIPVPMCVELIRNRLINGYYRQVEALEFDIKLMHQNCVNFNYEESEIVQASRQLRKHLLALARPAAAGDAAGGEGSSGGAMEGSNSSQWADPNEPDPALSFTIPKRAARHAGSQAQQGDSLLSVGASPTRRGGREPTAATSAGTAAANSRLRRSGTANSGISATEPLVSESILRIKRGREPANAAAVSASKSRRGGDGGAASRARRGSESDEPDSRARNGGTTTRSGRSTQRAKYTEQSSDEDESEGSDDGTPLKRRGASRATTRNAGKAAGTRGNSRVVDSESDGSESVESEEDSESSSKDSEDEDGSSDAGNRGRRTARPSTAARGNRSQKDARRTSQRRASRRGASSDEEEEEDGEAEQVTTTRSRRTLRAPANFAEEMAATMQKEHERNQALRNARRREAERLAQQQQQESSVEEVEVTTRSSRVVRAPPNYAEEMAAAMAEEHQRNQALRAVRMRQDGRSPDPAISSRNVGRLNPSLRYQAEQTRLAAEQSAQSAQRARHHPNGAGSSSSARGHEASSSSSSRHATAAAAAAVPAGRRVDPEVKRLMLLVVDCADELDREHSIFAEPVTEDIAPGYFEIIAHPVDLRTVREGINKRQYETVEAVVADIVQMYENCILYNDETSLLGHEAIRQRKEFQKLCKKRRLVE